MELIRNKKWRRMAHVLLVGGLLCSGMYSCVQAAYGSDEEDGNAALVKALVLRNVDGLRHLREKGVKIDEPYNVSGWTPLYSAAVNGYLDIVQYLCEEGVSKEDSDNDGVTPLSAAAGQGHVEVVRYLCAQKANKDTADRDGNTPLHKAVCGDRVSLYKNEKNDQKHLDVVQALCEEGADKELKDSDGWTPLRLAAMLGRQEMVKCLLRNGAEPVPSSEEYSPVIQNILRPAYKRFTDMTAFGGEWRPHAHQGLRHEYRAAMRTLALLAKARVG